VARIVVSGYVVRSPLGGQSWHYVQYLAGLARLGHEVFYVEDFGWPESCYVTASDEMTSDPTFGIRFLEGRLREFGLDGGWCYLAEDGRAHGASREELLDVCRRADLYLNIGNINAIPETAACRRRALVDGDPVFTQLRLHGMEADFDSYDVLFTYGENIGREGCLIATGGLDWVATRQPIVLELWPVAEPDGRAPFTTVMNWDAYGELEHDGIVYGHKSREFVPFFSLPAKVDEPMELAVDLPQDVERRLVAGGWRIVDPGPITSTACAYAEYIRHSRAEFSVAKHAYVVTRSGWFSERSAAYLASGRPVVLQDTGFSENLPVGDGLLTFTTYDDAVGAIAEVGGAYGSHARAARRIAEEHFGSDKVLTELLDAAGVGA
jgi:hypothetical protein